MSVLVLTTWRTKLAASSLVALGSMTLLPAAEATGGAPQPSITSSSLRTSTTVAPTTWTESFERAPTGVWREGGRYGGWNVEFDGYGTVQRTGVGTGNALELHPAVQPLDGVGTTSALVSSTGRTTGDVVVKARMRTLSQNAPLRQPTQIANPWEVAWLYWNYTAATGSGDQGTGIPTSSVRKGYYLALKPQGWELGKLDQSVFPGGQRFLRTGSLPVFAVGTSWRNVVIEQRGATISVRVGGVLLTTFTDGPASGGWPAWGTRGETVFTSGRVALYTEDARAQFDDIALTGRFVEPVTSSGR